MLTAFRLGIRNATHPVASDAGDANGSPLAAKDVTTAERSVMDEQSM